MLTIYSEDGDVVSMLTIYLTKKQRPHPPYCRQLAANVLAAGYSKEVRALLSQFDGSTLTDSNMEFKDEVDIIDPVCKMVVHTKNNEFKIAVDGKDYYFCCKRCMDKFSQDH